jgi:cysteine desulfurase
MTERRSSMAGEIYFDNSATTRPYDEVIEYMAWVSGNIYGNPSSLHTKGIEAEKLVKKSREIIADSLKADKNEILFTSGGTESNNLAIRGYLQANRRKGKHIITSTIEHPSVLEVFKHLENTGYKVDYIEVDKRGIVNPDAIKSKITGDTALISVIYVNNETGAIQPIEKIAEIKNSVNRDTAFHVDAVQAYGKLEVCPNKEGIDLMTLSSHKIHGPKGVGVLYVNKSIKISPILFGGGQESLLRSGTENVPGICGFGKAVEKIFKNIKDNRSRMQNLKSYFIEMLNHISEEYKIITPDNSSPYILNVSFPQVKAEVLLHHLEEKGIFVSTGSACSSRKNLYSHVLSAMGLDKQYIEGAIRFSFTAENKEEEVKKTIEALNDILPRIRIKRGGKR